jgi:hypothetical protein
MSPTRPKTKNDYADKGKQQFTGPTDQPDQLGVVRQKNTVMNPVGPATKSDCAGEASSYLPNWPIKSVSQSVMSQESAFLAGGLP